MADSFWLPPKLHVADKDETAISVLVCLISSIASSTSSEFEVRQGLGGWGEEGEVPRMEMPHRSGSGSSSSMTLPELSLGEEHPASTCEGDCRVDLSSGLSKGMEKRGVLLHL
ncbi:hypothetical protein KY290_010207 [Solanum tuberosum]|uniref:Uncharacterized protein n=1 Tax=Solanum tuberosum TaxID=4113 RepID=A0ABQ7VZA7_SOLTU|nr:hypothetical protein KY289_010592 [Solanum tuberosum]KAH0773070.1 hypothetical protein KY290_010207 [Solanum tuberosum]